jgi:hypothetical protein
VADTGLAITPAGQESNVPKAWKPTRAEPVPVVRCTKIKKDGNQCGRWSLRGTNVCIKHGGRLPDVQAHAAAVVENARLRIFGMADEATDALHDLIQPGTAEGVRLKAATEILDRAGVRGGVEITVDDQRSGDPTAELTSRLNRLAKGIIDGEVLEAKAHPAKVSLLKETKSLEQ